MQGIPSRITCNVIDMDIQPERLNDGSIRTDEPPTTNAVEICCTYGIRKGKALTTINDYAVSRIKTVVSDPASAGTIRFL